MVSTCWWEYSEAMVCEEAIASCAFWVNLSRGIMITRLQVVRLRSEKSRLMESACWWKYSEAMVCEEEIASCAFWVNLSRGIMITRLQVVRLRDFRIDISTLTYQVLICQPQ